jgi:hypothetical protein
LGHRKRHLEYILTEGTCINRERSTHLQVKERDLGKPQMDECPDADLLNPPKCEKN